MFFPQIQVKPTMTLTQSAIYEGLAFRFFHYFDVPAQGEYLLSVRNGASAIHLFSRLIKAKHPDLVYEVRTGATVTGYLGNPLSIYKMNSFSERQSTNIVQQCTVSDYGTLTDMEPLGGAETAGNRLEGDKSIDPEDIKILPNDTEFLLRITNPNLETSKAFLYLKWFETSKLA